MHPCVSGIQILASYNLENFGEIFVAINTEKNLAKYFDE